MSGQPKTQGGYDPLKSKGEQLTLEEVIQKFITERVPDTLALNLGCGQRPMPGMTNVDSADIDGVEIVHDLSVYPWPFEDESVGFIYMQHFLEHVPDWTGFWNEVWRITADSGRVVAYGPHASSDRYLQDPTHCQPLLDQKFLYLSKQWRDDNLIEHYGSDNAINFIGEFNPFEAWHPNFAHLDAAAKNYHRLHSRNALTDCAWFLKALKTDESREAYLKRIAVLSGE